MNAIFAAAKEVADFMSARKWRFCVIGGLAVQHWGEPRLTQDADLTLLTGFEKEESYVDALLSHFRPRREGAREFSLVNRILLLKTKDGTPVDISLAGLPYEEEIVSHATPFEFTDGIILPTCSADDLFVMKAFASRPKDWLDNESIVTRHGKDLDRAYILSRLKSLSEVVDRPELLIVARSVLEGKPWRR